MKVALYVVYVVISLLVSTFNLVVLRSTLVVFIRPCASLSDSKALHHFFAAIRVHLLQFVILSEQASKEESPGI